MKASPIIINEMSTIAGLYHLLLALILFPVICFSGCVAIPTPEVNSGNARVNINEETEAQFVLGVTTRADVIYKLGEPDAVSPDEHILVYRTEKIRGWAVVVIDLGPVMENRYLLAKFDEQGILQKMEYSPSWLISEDPSKMLTAVTTPDAKIVRLQKLATWLPGIDGFMNRRGFMNMITTTAVENEEKIQVKGRLLLTDVDLQFVSYKDLANSPAKLIIPFEAITEVEIDRFLKIKRLVVRTSTGEVHSFNILRGILVDHEALQECCEYLKSKVNH